MAPIDKGYTRPTERSRQLRRDMTDAERKLWHYLRSRQVAGIRFNRQYPTGPYICDFVARSKGLVIEVDGGQHAEQADYDARRTRYIEARGYRVLRFWNNDVMDNPEGLIAEIERAAIGLATRDMSKPAGSDW